MKIYKLIISIFLFVGLSSCNDWLNIEPKDTTTETDLFATGDGYRVALNGVYAQMAESSLYGQQLNWGFLDVIAHMYMLSELSSEYALSAKYSYTDEKVKRIRDMQRNEYLPCAQCYPNTPLMYLLLFKQSNATVWEIIRVLPV